MKLKKILAYVLTLCLLLTLLAPTATAVSTGNSSTVSNSGETNASGSNDTVLEKLAKKLGLMRKDDENKLSYVDGQWLVTDAKGNVSLATNDQLPECVQQLRAVAEHYAPTDLVAAFVVLEDAPTSEQYAKANSVPKSKTNKLQNKQDELIETIKTDVLDGNEPQIISRFTHLTNSVVINTAFADLEAIAALDGVKSVFISPVYSPAAVSESASTYTVSAGQMSGIPSVWEKLGYTGKGITIAILDTGLDLDHPSFDAAPEGAAWSKDYVQELLDTYDLNAESRYKRGTLDAGKVYYNEKVPFYFNYSMGTTNVLHNDGLSDHGTHVAGIAAANAVEGSGVVGMAPDAQIIAMKVFNSNTGGANMYDLVAALEDCITMGIDVVNMSLGTAAGFATANDEEIDKIFARISETDMILDVAVGNDGHSMYGSLYGNYKFPTDHIDTATIASPSTYLNSTAIASANNNTIYSAYFTLADDTPIHYMQSIEYLYGNIDYSLEILAGKSYDYVVIPNYGDYDDFRDEDGNSIVDGKIALVHRGVISFAEKALNAQDAGAVGVLIWDNEVGNDIFSFGMSTTYTDPDTQESYMPSIPVVLIGIDAGQKMADAEIKRMEPKADLHPRKDSTGGQMSSFSSWGVSPELRLIPDLTGVGGNVYSCYDGGEYGIMSGTSMATPQVAGVTAVVLQYIKDKFSDASLSQEQTRNLLYALLMSTAVPVIDSDTGLEASPRQQGAGLVNGYNAITANAYLSVAGSARPKAELGDSADGKYTFTFTVHNLSDKSRTYTLRSSLLCENYTEYAGMYFIAAEDTTLDNSAVTFSANTVTVPAGESATVTVSIELTEADKEWINTYFPSGNYVEGYVYLESEDEVTLSLPFLGFYQDWNKAPVFDTGMWYQNGFWGYDTDSVEAVQYYNALWTNLGSSDNDFLLGINPYGKSYADENGNLIYDPSHNVISPNGDGVLDSITDIYLSLMRNVKWLRLTYTDESGNILDEEVLDYVSKTMYNSSYGATLPFVYSWYYNSLYDFTDADGNYLPDGTKLTLTISAILAYGDESDYGLDKDGNRVEADDYLIEIPIVIDTSAPELLGYTEHTDENGRNYLTLTIKDANPACVALLNTSLSQTYDRYDDTDMVYNGDGTYSATVDVTGLGDKFVVALCDYGCNEAYFTVTWSESGTNNPQVNEDALYAFRVYDANVGYYYGADYMYGWGILDKETGEFTLQRSDAYEYYAIVAAEYVDGYVFAVDAGYNFLYMRPGLWNREWICNLGINVVDMAFDDTTGKMYLVGKTTEEVYNPYWDETYEETVCGLYTVDLLTGETERVATYSDDWNMPWAMTFADGKLYAIKKYYTGFWSIDTESGEMTRVCDADGEPINFTDAYGNATSAGYQQSMTYSSEDGKIYWAYYPNNGGNGGLFVIDPTDWSYEYRMFGGEQEYVGLLTLEDTATKLPASDEVTQLIIDQDSLILAPGGSETLKVSALPWNAPLTEELVWKSTDEDVVTVDSYGRVKAVGAGYAEITVSYGEISTSCSVIVIDPNGTMYGFNAYSSNGSSYTQSNWFGLDLATMKTTTLGYLDLNIVAGEYNGHDGYYYCYDDAGQCYRIEPDTGEAVALGTATGELVSDMAYDYSTGFMYALVLDTSLGTTDIRLVNMRTGALVDYATVEGLLLMTLACSMDGTMLSIDNNGTLYYLEIYQMEDSGIGGWDDWDVLDWDLDDDWDFDDNMGVGDETGTGMYVELTSLLKTNLTLYYTQSMCYDHVNDVLLWACGDTSTVYWIDLFSSDEPYMIELKTPDGLTEFQYFGLFVLPEYINELPYTEVDNLTYENVGMLVGTTINPPVSVEPLNATNQDIVYTSDDESIVQIVDGQLVAVGVGKTTVTATLDDDGDEFCVAFTVSVKASSDDLYSYLISDLYTDDGGYMIGMDLKDPQNYEPTGPILVDESNAYLLYAAEYIANTGYVYAYGYIMDDYESNWYYLTIDPSNWQVVEPVDLGARFSTFVYDMAYDYNNGILYAIGGSQNDTSVDLYYVDIVSGELTTAFVTHEAKAAGLVVTSDSDILVMVNSDDATAVLYQIDMEYGEMIPVMDTGIRSNRLSPMCYDYSTGYIYWNAFYMVDFFSPRYSSLYLIDLYDEDTPIMELGTVGSIGSQVTSMLLLTDSENYPEVPDEITNVILPEEDVKLDLNNETFIDCIIYPYTVEEGTTVTWSSSDPDIATVDEDGCVRAKSAGTVTITVSFSYNGRTITKTVTVQVYGGDDYLVAYNTDNMGFMKIYRTAPTQYEFFTRNESVGVQAMTSVNGIIYGYDDNGNFFSTCAASNYARTILGHHGLSTQEDSVFESFGATYHYSYRQHIRGMAWDSANERMLALGVEVCDSVTTYDGEEYTSSWATSGVKVYEVDMVTGALTELVTVFDEEAYMYDSVVASIAVDNCGNVYILSGYDDCISLLDMETGYKTNIVDFLDFDAGYASGEGNVMPMAYDEQNNAIYVCYAEYNNSYELYRFDLETNTLKRIDFMGDVIESVYYTTTFSFTGLVLNQVHEHSEQLSHLVGAKEATPTSDGYTGDLYCACGELLEKGEVIHTYVELSHIDATCSSDGQIIEQCSGCGNIVVTVLPATGEHSYTAVVTAPTCTEGGYTTYTCACGDSYIADETEPTGHTYVQIGRTDATCVTDGQVIKKCACGDVVIGVIPATGYHTYTAVVTAPTCTEGGYTTYTCACGNSYIADETDATGHTYTEISRTDASCVTDGQLIRKCACGDVVIEVIPATGEHNYTKVVTAPTCTDKGYTTYTCACGDTYVSDETDATGHTYTEISRTDATCAVDGQLIKKCACGDVVIEVIPATGEHKYYTQITPPTCTKDGYTVNVCDCGASYGGEEIKATGHEYTEISRTEATCATDGQIIRKCACGDVTIETVSATGKHDYSVVSRIEPTSESAGIEVRKCATCGDMTTEQLPQLAEQDYTVLIVLIILVLVAGAAAVIVFVIRKKKPTAK